MLGSGDRGGSPVLSPDRSLSAGFHSQRGAGPQCFPDSIRQPGPAVFQEGSGNWCQTGPTREAFGALASIDVDSANDTWVWSMATGGAVSADLRTADGRTYPVVTHNGLFFGWVPAPIPDQAAPVLTGYDANGTEISRTNLFGHGNP